VPTRCRSHKARARCRAAHDLVRQLTVNRIRVADISSIFSFSVLTARQRKMRTRRRYDTVKEGMRVMHEELIKRCGRPCCNWNGSSNISIVLVDIVSFLGGGLSGFQYLFTSFLHGGIVLLRNIQDPDPILEVNREGRCVMFVRPLRQPESIFLFLLSSYLLP
jgi:hypothetical protein